MLHLPCYILSGLLALMLVTREYQNNRIHRGLIDKILESRGLNPLPDEHPLVEAVKTLAKPEAQTEEQRRLIRTAQQRVKFNIPNMQMPKPGSNY